MPNDIVVQSDKNGGKVHLSADRVYDLNKNKTQDVINAEFEPLMQLDSEVAIVIDGRSCTLGAVSGQYVILQNSTIAGKSDGLYTVATGKTIPIGATNVTADMLSDPIPRGGLNSLKNTLNSKAETDASNISSATDWRSAIGLGTSGAFPLTIAQGGTGSTGVETISTISNIITASSGYTVTDASIKRWGKVVMLFLAVKKSTAVTTAQEMDVGTLSSEYYPVSAASVIVPNTTIDWAMIIGSGKVRLRGTWAANATNYILATYIIP